MLQGLVHEDSNGKRDPYWNEAPGVRLSSRFRTDRESCRYVTLTEARSSPDDATISIQLSRAMATARAERPSRSARVGNVVYSACTWARPDPRYARARARVAPRGATRIHACKRTPTRRAGTHVRRYTRETGGRCSARHWPPHQHGRTPFPHQHRSPRYTALTQPTEVSAHGFAEATVIVEDAFTLSIPGRNCGDLLGLCSNLHRR